MAIRNSIINKTFADSQLNLVDIPAYFTIGKNDFDGLYNGLAGSNNFNPYGFDPADDPYINYPYDFDKFRYYDQNRPTLLGDYVNIDSDNQSKVDFYSADEIYFFINLTNNRFGRAYTCQFDWYINPVAGCTDPNDVQSYKFATSSGSVNAGTSNGGDGQGSSTGSFKISAVVFPHTQTGMNEDTQYSIFAVLSSMTDSGGNVMKNLMPTNLLQRNFTFGHPATAANISLGGSVEQPDFTIDIVATNTGETAGYTRIVRCRIVDRTSNPRKVKTLADVASFQVPGKIRGGANGTATAYAPFSFTTADKFTDGSTAWAQIYNNNTGTWETIGSVTVRVS